MIPPWMIEELEHERRRQERERDSLRLPLGEEAREPEKENPDQAPVVEPRGVTILDISPGSITPGSTGPTNVIPM